MSVFHTDAPITGTDDHPDKLNRTEYSKRIGKALLLKKGSSPIVVSIEGPWGYGKTSAINLIRQYFSTLKGPSKPIVFAFNPWMVGSAENIVQEYIVQFGAAIGLASSSKNAQNASKQLLAYSNIFSVLKWVPGAEPWASILKKVTEGAGAATGKIAELKALDVSKQRDEVVKALIKINKPIVVLIDDLDRLPPDEVYQMIRAIKAVTDFPRTAFLLAFERQYIEKALKLHGIEDSGLYLDKIIQVRLHLPVIAEKDLQELSIFELNNLANINLTSFFDGDQDRLAEIYTLSAKPLIKTPRELKRIFNRLRFIEPNLRQNVCFSDMFALEVLAIKAPYVYEHLRICPWAYNGQESEYELGFKKRAEIVEQYKEEREKVIASVPTAERKYIIEIIDKLFPLVDSTYGVVDQDTDYYYTRGRVASPDRLQYALTFSTPSGEISSIIISRFMENENLRSHVIEEIYSNNLLERFIELLYRVTREAEPVNLENFIIHICQISSSPNAKLLQEKPRDILKLSPMRLLWLIMRSAFEKVQMEERFDILMKLMKERRFIAIAGFGLDECLSQHGFFGEKEEVEMTKRWVSEDQLKKLKDCWIKSVGQEVLEGSIFDKASGDFVLYKLGQISSNKAKRIVKPLMENEDDFDNLFRTIGKSGRDNVKGVYAKLSEDKLKMFGDIEEIRERAKSRLDQGVEDIALKAIYNSVLTGEGYYLSDNTKTNRH